MSALTFLEKEDVHPAIAINANEIDQKICNDIDELTAENNQIWSSPDHNRREYVHSFFQYPAMMVPVVQKRIIEILISNLPSILTVLDPYLGSGTSLVACMENGLNCYGQDVNPLAILVSKTRTGPFYFNAIKKKKEKFFFSIDTDQSSEIEINFRGLNKWFKAGVLLELSKIVRAIKVEPRVSIRRFYWVILAETVRLTSNDRTSTFKLHARSLTQIDERNLSAIEYFKKHFQSCLEDIELYATLLTQSQMLSKGAYIGDIHLSLSDSKTNIIKPKNDSNLFDLVVTSPPYGDNKTTIPYGQHSYLPLQWINLEDISKDVTIDYLKTTMEIDNRGLGGKIKIITDVELKKLFRISPTLEDTIHQIKLVDSNKVQKVVNFFYDIHESIKNIHESLQLNSYQVWTIGNRTVAGVEIKNDQIMGDFIRDQGSILIKSISREILNRRMAKRNNSGKLMIFEDILIFRKIA